MNTQTIISGALLAQVVIGVVMFCAASILQASSPRTAFLRGEPTVVSYGTELLVLLLLTLAMLLATTEMSGSWGALFRNTNFVGLSREAALPVVFVVDILITARLVHRTGGSLDSPFQPVFFLIPTLALLLYEPSIRIAFYSFLVSTLFIVLLRARPLHNSLRPAARTAYALVSIASLGLAVAIGLLTRTCPENLC